MNVRDTNVKEIKFWISFIIILSFTTIIPILIYDYLDTLSIFVFLIILWWFLPTFFGYFPLYIKRLIYSRKTLYLYKFFLLSPLFASIIFYLDVNYYPVSNVFLKISFDILKNTYQILGAIIGIIGLTWIVKGSNFFLNMIRKKVLIIVPEQFKWKIITMGYSKQYIHSSDFYEKGFPVTITNNLKRSLVIASVLFYVKKENLQEIVPLNNHVEIQPNTTELIFLPWEETSLACSKIFNYQLEKQKGIICKIGIWDEFKAEILEGDEVLPFFIASEKRNLDFWKDHENYFTQNSIKP